MATEVEEQIRPIEQKSDFGPGQTKQFTARVKNKKSVWNEPQFEYKNRNHRKS